MRRAEFTLKCKDFPAEGQTPLGSPHEKLTGTPKECDSPQPQPLFRLVRYRTKPDEGIGFTHLRATARTVVFAPPSSAKLFESNCNPPPCPVRASVSCKKIIRRTRGRMSHLAKRVLLVDDHETVRKALRDLFERAGYTCVEAENGALAVDAAEQFNPDLIVLDFSMPVMNGLEAAPLFKKKFPRTPIIMFSMFADEAFSKAAVAAGVSAVVSKENASSQLVPKAEWLLKAE